MEESKITEEMLLDLLRIMNEKIEANENNRHYYEYEIKKYQKLIFKLDRELEDIEKTKSELTTNINIIRERNKNNVI